MQNQMNRELQLTADGSHTLFIPEMNEHYHSINGAIQESTHIFIKAGLHSMKIDKIRILEIGFGTGLNAFLTLRDVMQNRSKHIEYFSIELYPLDEKIYKPLNYGEMVWPEQKDFFFALHQAAWNTSVSLTDCFILHKIEGDSNTAELPDGIDLVYFDAFAPDKQPEMWKPEIFQKIYSRMSPEGTIVTYCAKGEVRRCMQAAGFHMQRLPGPPGKRHMLLGQK